MRIVHLSTTDIRGGASRGAYWLHRALLDIGIDSVMRPYEDRVEAWNRIAADLPMDRLESMISEHGLAELPDFGRSILEGGVRGRAVVDPSR